MDFTLKAMTPIPEEEDKPVGHMFLMYGIGLPVFSLSAMTALQDLLEPNGTLHATESPLGPFYAFGVRRIIDALDYSRSKIEYAYSLKQKKNIPREIRRYHFRLDQLGEAPIFKIPEFPLTKVFVSDLFKNRCIENQLAGFQYQQVFPPIDEAQLLRDKYLRKHKEKRR